MPEPTQRSPLLPVDKELIQNSKDHKEKETGVFHWRNEDGSYTPVTEMSSEELDKAIEVSESNMERLHDNILRMHKQMHAWQYRIDKLWEGKHQRFDGISSRAANQIKELTE